MTVLINEFHYDNAGTDEGEFIELAGLAGTDLTGWSLVLYNGSSGDPYGTVSLSGTFTDDTGTGFGFLAFDAPASGLQNDFEGIALVDGTNAVREFLSYEGTFTAVSGAAAGLTSVDVLVSESGATSVGSSLQRAGNGVTGSAFYWATPGPETKGAVNTDQDFSNTALGGGLKRFLYTQDFDGEAAGARYTDTGDAGVDHDLVNNLDESSVDSENPGLESTTTLGFDARYMNTRNDSGLTDGDFVGVSNFAGAVGAYTSGAQGYQMSDTDGAMVVEFDTIDTSGAGEVKISMDLFVQETGWETSDSIVIGARVMAADGTVTTVSMLDTTGLDIDDLALEDLWTPLGATVAAAAVSVQVFASLDSNSSSEAIYLDTLVVTTPLIVTQNFDSEATGGRYTDTGDAGVNHDLVNNAGEAPVNSENPGLATTDTIGFTARYVNSLEDVGLTDGDFVGVSDFTGAVGAYTSGTQGYQMSDTDGTMIVEFETIDTSGVGALDVSIDLFAAATGWEAADAIIVGVITEDPSGTFTTTTMLDTTGLDIDDLTLEGVWSTLSTTIDASAASVQVFASLTSNSSSEAIYLDSLLVTTEGSGTDPDPDPDPVAAKIHEIQGAGTASDMEGALVIVQGVVVGDYDDAGELTGFFLQEEDSDHDADLATSEGIFVFVGDATGTIANVSEGDLVTVTGTVDEFFDVTQIDTLTDLSIDDSDRMDLVTAASLSLPAAGAYTAADTYESVESMLTTISTKMVVSEYFELARYGQIQLTAEDRAFQFAQTNAPDADGYTAFQEQLATTQIILDDTNNIQNAYQDPDVADVAAYPQPGLSVDNYVRGGDSITDLTGVMHWSWAGASGTDAWRLRPTESAEIEFTEENPRTDAPDDVGGDLVVASFNVLNFFSTVNVGVDNAGPTQSLEPRGADSLAEQTRQLDKLVAAMTAMDADIFGLVEIENEFQGDQNGDGQFAIQMLVDALNADAGAGTYAHVDPGRGFVDTSDAISQAFIYKTSSVEVTIGSIVGILDDTEMATLGLGFTNDVFDGVSTNRASLAASFTEVASGESLTIAVNHFKSKGSINSAPGNTDAGDGAGNNNALRTQAAEALDAWLDSDPTGTGNARTLILGDLNAYAMEDPVTLLKDAGYTDLAQSFIGSDAYGYVFDGQIGTLDYAMANDSLLSDVTGVTEWHINADEVPLFDYNDAVLDPDEASFEVEPGGLDIYAADPFRSSDHDPVLIGLDLSATVEAPIEIAEGRFGITRGTEASEIFRSGDGKRDFMYGGPGDAPDYFVFGAETFNGSRDRDTIADFDLAADVIVLEDGAEFFSISEYRNGLIIRFDNGLDRLVIRGEDLTIDGLMVQDADALGFV